LDLEKQKLLLATPPLTQLNTPYPATAYLKGFLNNQNIASLQIDLGINLFLKIFNKSEFKKLFELLEPNTPQFSNNTKRIIHLKEKYISTIDLVIAYLQKKDITAGYNICKRGFLPEASRFSSYHQMDWIFEPNNIHEKASFLATLYLEDIADFIQEAICPFFEFSKYGEKLVLSNPEFDLIEKKVETANDPISNLIKNLFKSYLDDYRPTHVCFTIPFPGNLLSTLICGKVIKDFYPNIKTILGGGYISTELRQLADDRIFKFTDYIVLDRGENALMDILSTKKEPSHTFYLKDNQLCFHNSQCSEDYPFYQMGDPDFSDFDLNQYLSLTDSLNPMHRLWSDGQWNKISLAYGCYWSRCSFCDTHLKYINCFEPTPVNQIISTIKNIISQTQHTGFHFVDEAAPLNLLKELALELLRENIAITWWTNIRFEKGFTRDVCRLLAASGCIGVSGGIEVANDRLLKKIKKGITIKHATQVLHNFKKSGIHVHAYLMYGFPSQSELETIESLEIVRQFFKNNLIQSAYWHQFTLTIHSEIYHQPDKYQIKINKKQPNLFANNDIPFTDLIGCDHENFSFGLKKAIFNFMNGVGIDFKLQEWFEFQIPKPQINSNYIKKLIKSQSHLINPKQDQSQIVWMGNLPVISSEHQQKFSKYCFHDPDKTYYFQCQNDTDEWICQNLNFILIDYQPIKTINEIDQKLKKEVGITITQIKDKPIWRFLKAHGLLTI
jgi:hypothetical protein